MYKYLHDAKNRIVYQVPAEPDVNEQKDRRGRRTGWSVNMRVLITRADNKLNGNQWQHATSSYPRQAFDAHYEKSQVISYFLMHHTPDGDPISQEEYVELQAQYDRFARNQ